MSKAPKSIQHVWGHAVPHVSPKRIAQDANAWAERLRAQRAIDAARDRPAPVIIKREDKE